MRSSGSGRDGSSFTLSAAPLELCGWTLWGAVPVVLATLPEAVRLGLLLSPGAVGACATRTERMEKGHLSPISRDASSIFVMNCWGRDSMWGRVQEKRNRRGEEKGQWWALGAPPG